MHVKASSRESALQATMLLSFQAAVPFPSVLFLSSWMCVFRVLPPLCTGVLRAACCCQGTRQELGSYSPQSRTGSEHDVFPRC